MEGVTAIEVSVHSYSSYMYVHSQLPSLLVTEKEDNRPPCFVFHDGVISTTKDGSPSFFQREKGSGVTDWFLGRQVHSVVRMGSLPVRSVSGESTITFTSVAKVVVFGTDGGEDYSFVGDSEDFVCGLVRGSIFDCLKQIFTESSPSLPTQLNSYHEDNSRC